MPTRGVKAGTISNLGYAKDAALNLRVMARTKKFVGSHKDLSGSDFLDCLVAALDSGILDKAAVMEGIRKAKQAFLDDLIDFEKNEFVLVQSSSILPD